MKKSFLIVLSLFGSIAFACPDFSGTYICSEPDVTVNEQVVNVQSATELTTTDSNGSAKLTLNGKFTMMAGELPMQASGSCNDTHYLLGIEVPNLISIEQKWSKTANGYIVEQLTESGESSTITCIRK